jgi:hypothetical protein
MSATNEGQTRRALLAAGASGLAAAAAATIGLPLAAQAQATPVYLGVSGQTTGTTTEVISTGTDAIAGTTSASGRIGVVGYSSAATGETMGVMGRQASASGSGVYGQADAGGTGVFGLSGGIFVTSPTLTGVYGRTTDADVSTRGVWGESDSGVGVYGSSHGTKPAVLGTSDAGAPGVQGVSTGGRGGVFKGGQAQLRLIPSLNATHPASGLVGDLFLDKHKRLWFCKGGTTWTQIA